MIVKMVLFNIIERSGGAKAPRVSKGLLSRRGLFIPVSSPVATFEQSENVAIAHLLALPRGVASATASICACARC